jgi:hypothetical protein
MIRASMRRWLPPLLGLLLSACVRYEYEEEVFLEVDGSGEIRINGSRELFAALRGVGGSPDPHFVTAETLRRFYQSPDLEVLSIKSSRREGRTYLHLRARFEDLRRLAKHPAFAGRRFVLEDEDDELRLEAEIHGGERLPGVRGLSRQGQVGFRFHFPSPVRFHNAPDGIRRGNILAWEQTVAEHLQGNPIQLEAHFDQTSVLAASLFLFGSAALLALTVISLGLYLTTRHGRRELKNRAPLEAMETLESKP